MHLPYLTQQMWQHFSGGVESGCILTGFSLFFRQFLQMLSFMMIFHAGTGLFCAFLGCLMPETDQITEYGGNDDSCKGEGFHMEV